MKQLALVLPGDNIDRIQGFPYLKPEFSAGNLGFVISQALNLVFIGAGFLMFFWMLWGVFEYIIAGGEKDKLAKARSRIIWAIIGFVILILAFTVSQYVKDIIPQQPVPATSIKTPN